MPTLTRINYLMWPNYLCFEILKNIYFKIFTKIIYKTDNAAYIISILEFSIAETRQSVSTVSPCICGMPIDREGEVLCHFI